MLNEESLLSDEYISNKDDYRILIKEIIGQKKAQSSKDKGVSNIPNNSNNTPFLPDYDDLTVLYHLCRSRKVCTVLEFGVGNSTFIMAKALEKNKQEFSAYTEKHLRRANLYEIHSCDSYHKWINSVRKRIPSELKDKNIIHLHHSRLRMSTFNGRVCTMYDSIPNICPDLIYLDGPDQFSANGSIRGIHSRNQDRMPMAGDILSFEHYLQPGTLIIVDGRTSNARFLRSNFQRNWQYFYSSVHDQHYFELQEDPLGPYNKRMLDHCLGDLYYQRVDNSQI